MNTYISKDINRFNYLLSETDAVYHDMSKRLGLSDSISQILYTICVHYSRITGSERGIQNDDTKTYTQKICRPAVRPF